MSKQPEAIRLAAILESSPLHTVGADLEAAAELRRLHALNQEWEAKSVTWFASPEAAARLAGYRELAAQRDAAELMSLALKAQKYELLKALKAAIVHAELRREGSVDVELLRAAIAKVEGKK